MNAITMKTKMQELASTQTKHAKTLTDTIIESICNIYYKSTNLFESDAIYLFQEFLSTGVLNYPKYNIKF